MAYQSIGLGTSADDGTGDSLRVGGDKINDNFSEIYTLLGTGSALTSGLSTTASVVTLSSAVGTFTTLTPAVSDGTALGSASLEFSDLFLADASTIQFGADQDVTLTHSHNSGLILGRTSTADDAFPIFSLATGDNNIASGDKLGQINWFAPNEGAGTDAIVAAASIFVASEGDFSASNNASTMYFSTSTSGTPTERMKITSGGNIVFPTDGNTFSFGADQDVILTHVADTGLLLNAAMKIQFRDSAISIGSTDDGDLSIAADDEIDLTSTLIDINGNVEISGTATTTGVHTFTATPVFSADVTIEDDLFLDSDGAVIHLGEDNEITLTHSADSGLILGRTSTADDAFSILTLSTGDNDIAAGDKLGQINWYAPNEGAGTDAIAVAASIFVASEGDFSSSNNASTMYFSTSTSGAPTERMKITSGGNIVFPTDGNTFSFGANSEVILTHVHDTGLLLNAAMKIQFRDAAIHISSTADGDLAIAADDEIDLTSTLIDINGNVEISGTATTTGVHTFTAIPVLPANTIDSDMYVDGSIDTAHIADNQITLAKMAGGTDGNIISYDASGDPVAIATGSDGQVLTSTGAGSPPAFEAVPPEFASGTVMVFHQTNAPTGWTKNTTAALNDGALRTTTGTVGTGGSVAFETAFASQAVAGTNGNTAATTIATSTLPAHTHVAPSVVLWYGGTKSGAPTLFEGTTVAANSGTPSSTYYGPNTGSTGGGGSHVHGGSTFSGTAIDLNVKFYDVIVAAKD